MNKNPEELYKKENLPEQINNLIEFGKQNGGWNNLLELPEIEEMVFQVGTSWQEVEPLMSEKDILENRDVTNSVNIINDSYEELKSLAEGIRSILQDFKNSEDMEMIKKSDARVVLKTLQEQSNLVDFSVETQDDIISLITLMQEFQNLYSKWINSKNSFENLLQFFKKYSQDIKQKQAGIKSNFPQKGNLKSVDDISWRGTK